ncbi:hypothetical protein Efla_005235 [Eimeria flavescens]
MGNPKQPSSKSSGLHQRRQRPADASCSGAGAAAMPPSDAESCSDSLPANGVGFDCPGEDNADPVNSRHAHSTDKLRASTDYRIGEKPLQVLLAFGVIAVLVLLAYGPSCLLGSDEGNRLFHLHFSDLSPQRQQELRFCVLQVVGCLTAALVGYCLLKRREGPLVRPHPAFWKLVHGVCLTYFLLLVALIAMHREDGRFFLQMLVPGLNAKTKNVFSGTLVLDCSVSKKTLVRQLTSLWFISHAIGWFIKMCIFRSWIFNLTFSILFEFSEMSLQWLVPEFQECWHFDWLGVHPTDQKIPLQFAPSSSSGYEWSFFRTPRHLLMTSLLVFLSLLAEIHVFLLMTVLDIPAPHWVNPLRLVFLGLLAFPAVAEYYAHVHLKCGRMSGNLLLFGLILGVELLVSMKYGVDRFFSTSPGADVVVPWVFTGGFFSMWCLCYFSKASQGQEKFAKAGKGAQAAHRTSFRDSASSTLLRIPPQACFLPLLYLFRQYYYGAA